LTACVVAADAGVAAATMGVKADRTS